MVTHHEKTKDEPSNVTTKEARAYITLGVMQERQRLAPLFQAIKAVLGTEEDGEALVEAARNAHLAELELASLRLKVANRLDAAIAKLVVKKGANE